MVKRTLSVILAVLMASLVTTVLSGCAGKKQVAKAPVTEEAPAPPPKVEEQPAVKKEEPKVTETPKPTPKAIALQDIHFDFDKYDLRPDAREILAQNAEILKANPDVTVAIEGHCDEWGTVEYNLALGAKRAEAAKSYFVSYGIDAKRLTTISYGKERPLDPGHTPEAWAKNRRCHFVVTSAGPSESK